MEFHVLAKFNQRIPFGSSISKSAGQALSAIRNSCLDQEGWGPFSPKRNDFTPCFERAALAVPNAVLVVAGIVLVGSLFSRHKQTRGVWSITLLCWKLCFLVAASVFSAAHLAVAVSTSPTPLRDQHVYCCILFFISNLVSIFITSVNHTRTRRASDILLACWTVSLVLFIPRIRTLFLLVDHSDRSPLASFITFVLCTSMTAMAFFIECLGPEWRGRRGRICLEDQPSENPLLTANLFSRLTFSYQSYLIKLASTKHLEEEDIPSVLSEDRSGALCNTLEHNWSKVATETYYKSYYAGTKLKPSLLRSLARSYGRSYSAAICFKIFSTLLVFTQPQLLRALLQFVESYTTDEPQPPIRGISIAVGMFVTRVLHTLFNQQCSEKALKTGMRVKVGILTLLFKKSLVLSPGEKVSRPTGEMINLQSVDASRLGNLCLHGAVLISAPIEIIAACLSLWFLLGWPSLLGVIFMFLSLPLNMILAEHQAAIDAEQTKWRNQRIRLMNELITNMRSIKMFSLEPTYSRRMQQLRQNHELRLTRKLGIAKAMHSWYIATIPLVVSFATFAAYTLARKLALTADVVFPAIALYGLLQLPLTALPNAINVCSAATVSEARLVDFLEAEELQADACNRVIRSRGDPKPRLGDELVSIEDGEFHWDKVGTALRDINISVKMGQLVAVLGHSGQGKSSLLAAILGEMTRVYGEVTVRGSIAYVSQEPFVLSASVQDNITFGHVYDESLYHRVLDACILRADVESLPQGNDTEIGPNGKSLSRSQLARIMLARALYARTDIYIFDDPLSSVEERVAADIFNNVIGPQGLLRNKTRIWCTTKFAFLPSTTHMIMLHSGQIIEQATYHEVMSARDGPIYSLVTERWTDLPSNDTSTVPETGISSQNVSAEELTSIFYSERQAQKRSSRMHFLSLLRDAQPISALADMHHTIQRLRRNVKRREVSPPGPVRARTYISAVTPVAAVIFLLAAIGTEALSIASNLVLRSWADENAHASWSHLHNLLIYGLACSLSSFLAFVTCVSGWVGCSIRASTRFHDAAFSAVMGSPLSFFNPTTQSQIMNHFSFDLYVVDNVLAVVCASFFTSLVSVFGALYIVGMGAPIVLVVILLIFPVYRSMMNSYTDASKEMKHYNDTSRTPIFDFFGEAIGGLSVIRAYNQQDRFVANNEAIIDRHQSFYLHTILMTRWMSIRTELIGSLVMLASALAPIWALANARFVDAGLVGLTVSYAVSVTKHLIGVMRCGGEIESTLISLKHIAEYTDLAQEAPSEVEDLKPPSTWPEEGRVVFRHYSARYNAELDLSLHDVCFDIRPGEKIAVCGKAGAGKSSLALALLRILEPAEGNIVIDDIDISELGLHDLRSAISMIPADPQLFEGTIRDNVDPTGAYSDAHIWSALSQAHLKPFIETMAQGLSLVVLEGGRNLSQSQRQLVCLTQALLRKSKIMILEKVDSKVEATMQEMLSEDYFQGITVITLFQRWSDTIMDNDRVMVMDQGRVAEFHSPSALLSSHHSIFASLYESDNRLNER